MSRKPWESNVFRVEDVRHGPGEDIGVRGELSLLCQWERGRKFFWGDQLPGLNSGKSCEANQKLYKPHDHIRPDGQVSRSASWRCHPGDR